MQNTRLSLVKRKKGSEEILLSERLLLTFVKHKLLGMPTTFSICLTKRRRGSSFSRGTEGKPVQQAEQGFFFRNVLLLLRSR